MRKLTAAERDAMVRPEVEKAARTNFPMELLWSSALVDIERQDAAPEEKARRREFWRKEIEKAYGVALTDA